VEAAFLGVESPLPIVIGRRGEGDLVNEASFEGSEVADGTMINIEDYHMHIHTSSHHIHAVRRMRTKQMGERLSASAPS
jgi:hypothetical protein